MSTPKHTPGPWTVKGEDTVVGPQGNTIAECCGYSIRATDKDQIRQGGREANATLIAAAPAMYAALQHAAMSYHHPACKCKGEYAANPEKYCGCHVQKAKAALAQAEDKP